MFESENNELPLTFENSLKLTTIQNAFETRIKLRKSDHLLMLIISHPLTSLTSWHMNIVIYS